MKTPRNALALLLGVLVATTPVLAQERDGALPRMSPNASTSFTLGVTDITIHYGAPLVRDRVIYGDLVPFDAVWRTGANEATAVTFSTDVVVEGQALEAGTYGLFTVPGRESWTIIFNEAPEQWGAYQYDEARDVLRVSVQPQRAPKREIMTFYFDDLRRDGGADAVDVVLEWADTRVPFTVHTDTDAHVAALGDAAAASGEWRRAGAYANYALQTGRHADRALAWAEAAVRGQETFGTLSLKARVQAAAGDYAAALQTADRALALGGAMAQPPSNLEAFREQVAEWRTRG
jgi:hypothetical protein